jgi:hypothetical protein
VGEYIYIDISHSGYREKALGLLSGRCLVDYSITSERMRSTLNAME